MTDWPPLRPVGLEADASVAMMSVPVPQGCEEVPQFAGMPSQAVPLAWYPGQDGPGQPRQYLVLGAADKPFDTVPALVSGKSPQADEWTGPELTQAVLSQKKTGMLMREVNELVIRSADRELGLRLGLRHDGHLRWWQFTKLEALWSGPVCRAYRIAGYIPIEEVDESFFIQAVRTNTGHWLHRHNWLLGELYLLVFANGLVRVTARHLNNRFFDKGEELQDVTPLLAFRAPRAQLDTIDLDGTERDFDLGDARLDLDRCADLYGPEHPGRLSREADLVILQPYTGVEMLFGDYEPRELHELKASERRIWPGIARCFGFDLSVAQAPIRTQRLLPPLGWIAHCGTLWPDGALPVSSDMDRWVDAYRDQARGLYSGLISHRFLQTSAFWDGEYAHALMLHAYRHADPEHYRAAMHHAYALADLGIDHTDFTIRIWYQRKHSTGPVLFRNLGLLAGYLEEGDPYLLRMAESLAEAAYAMDRSNWPRRSYGRDGAYIRSLTRLFDVTGERFYLRRAGEACHRAAQCQRPDGSFADQGGAVEAHGHSSEIIKPWMNAILSEVMVDYLERQPEDEAIAQTVIRCADWLVSVLQEDEDGSYWPYEVAWGENEGPPYAQYVETRPQTRHPAGEVQLDYCARIMLWATTFTGDPRYARAWKATYDRQYERKGQLISSYGVVKVPENFIWYQAHLWQAHKTRDGIVFDSEQQLLEPDAEAVLELPDGTSLTLRRDAQGVSASSRDNA